MWLSAGTGPRVVQPHAIVAGIVWQSLGCVLFLVGAQTHCPAPSGLNVAATELLPLECGWKTGTRILGRAHQNLPPGSILSPCLPLGSEGPGAPAHRWGSLGPWITVWKAFCCTPAWGYCENKKSTSVVFRPVSFYLLQQLVLFHGGKGSHYISVSVFSGTIRCKIQNLHQLIMQPLLHILLISTNSYKFTMKS